MISYLVIVRVKNLNCDALYVYELMFSASYLNDLFSWNGMIRDGINVSADRVSFGNVASLQAVLTSESLLCLCLNPPSCEI